MKKNCIVAQSGGPTAAINASLAGVIKGAIDSEVYDKIYGSVHGIQGVLNLNFLDLSDATPEFIDKLQKTPAMYLGSCRFKLQDMEESTSEYEKIFDIFEQLNIGAFFYIGGNDSMDTVAKLSKYSQAINSDIRIAGIPKTIDNDLIETDHTPGFGSAAKYIASGIREMAYDTCIYNVSSVTIVEIMGRDAGWLTAAAALARNEYIHAPHLIYLPEVNFYEEQFLSDLQKLLAKYRNVIVAVSEGIHDENGNYLAASLATADKFGHAQLSGAGKYLENLVKNRLGIKVRSVEINIPQRCAGHLISKTDITEAFRAGEAAVALTELGKTGFMTNFVRVSENPYTCDVSSVSVARVANKAKAVPREYINKDGNDVTEAMINYLKPLIQGEVYTEFTDGIVDYLDISHLTNQ